MTEEQWIKKRDTLIDGEATRRYPSATLGFGFSLSATLDVRGLSLPDQTRIVVRRHPDRLLVSLHRGGEPLVPHVTSCFARPRRRSRRLFDKSSRPEAHHLAEQRRQPPVACTHLGRQALSASAVARCAGAILFRSTEGPTQEMMKTGG
jgi:hypothetical protein